MQEPRQNHCPTACKRIMAGHRDTIRALFTLRPLYPLIILTLP
jgi:hypothetical protein